MNQHPISGPPTTNAEETTNKKQPKKRQRKSTSNSNASNAANSSPSKKKATINQTTNQNLIMSTGNGNNGLMGSNQCSSPSLQHANMGGGNFPPNHALVSF